ncbi:MAG: UDP-N-acetylglucosamine--N-acetylmuramyl-(pentapeptide) pyrophosphoryl-undecaprenol N-acetylglucosamine transferase [Actinobacteria bacterium]|nr:UDP-N-acetylglucosamine--N-acetylmuramyl-(pentapeptide) pyrophosphoryl-undecaprenol N-acetylglucosamine transferase [Actinomycetota bacterium]
MKIVLAGGGTAGHIEPALAVARTWRANHAGDQIEFLGTKSGLENQLVPAAGFNLSHISKVVIPRKISLSLFVAPTTLTQAFLEARAVLKGADLLIGFGGYVSAPAYLAARSLKIPIVIHEANAKPGLANRLGALFTNYLAVAQPVKSGKLSRALITGLPLRSDVSKALQASGNDWAAARSKAKAALGMSASEPVIAIFFGSQGSVALNKVIADSLPIFEKNGAQLLHAVGKSNQLPKAGPSYKPVSYLEDMASTYLAADLIIARSGAVTCSEVNALGKYALFIPLPIGNGEQKVNARLVTEQSRGEIIDQSEFNPQWIEKHLDRLLKNCEMASPAGNSSDLHASEKIVALMEEALKVKAK